jgi:hypothetical protein
MVESMANSVEDYLIDGLSFKLKPGASYINERKSVTYHPQGSNVYTTNGTKLIKLLITGDNWLDPSTFRVAFDLQNMEGIEQKRDADGALLYYTAGGVETTTNTGVAVMIDKRLRTLGGAHTFFKRMRVLCNGQIVEDIDDYNRVHEMFLTLTPAETRLNDAAEAFGSTWDIGGYPEKIGLDDQNLPGVRGNNYQTVLFKPLSGLLMQSKYIPLRYCPLTIELELVNDALEPIIAHGEVGADTFTEFNTSVTWQIINVMAKCDVCTLDNALDNSYAEHLLSGKSLPINYNTYISQMQSLLSGTVGQKSVRLNITRSLSRLKSVFVTLQRQIPFVSKEFIGRKKWNDFYSPMWKYGGNFNAQDNRGEFEFQLQLGSKLYPEYPIRSHGEGYYQLRKTIGAQSNKHHSLEIGSHEYRHHKFILGTDTERVLEAGFTGMNTRAGDILNVRFEHNTTDTDAWAHAMHVILHSDNIMEIRDSGITVFD